MSQQKPYEIDLRCPRCDLHCMGRVTDKSMEKDGWRRVDGSWVCGFCTGLGLGGFMHRRDPEENPGDQEGHKP